MIAIFNFLIFHTKNKEFIVLRDLEIQRVYKIHLEGCPVKVIEVIITNKVFGHKTQNVWNVEMKESINWTNRFRSSVLILRILNMEKISGPYNRFYNN